MAIGYWIAGVGAAIVAVVGAYATLRYHEGQTSNPTALVRRPRRSDAIALLGWFGAIAGLFARRLAGALDLPAGGRERTDAVHGGDRRVRRGLRRPSRRPVIAA